MRPRRILAERTAAEAEAEAAAAAAAAPRAGVPDTGTDRAGVTTTGPGTRTSTTLEVAAAVAAVAAVAAEAAGAAAGEVRNRHTIPPVINCVSTFPFCSLQATTKVEVSAADPGIDPAG